MTRLRSGYSKLWILLVVFFCLSPGYSHGDSHIGQLVDTISNSCQQSEFKYFFQQFIQSQDIQEKYTNDIVTFHTLNLKYADRINIYDSSIIPDDKTISREDAVILLGAYDSEKIFDNKAVSRKDVSVFLHDDAMVSAKNIKIEWVFPTTAKASLVNPQRREYKMSFVFRKRDGCWWLTDIINETLPDPEILRDKDAERAANCFKVAKKLEYMMEQCKLKFAGWPNKQCPQVIVSDPESGRFFDRLLYSYLCAAQNGLAEAAFKAAGLGESGEVVYCLRII